MCPHGGSLEPGGPLHRAAVERAQVGVPRLALRFLTWVKSLPRGVSLPEPHGPSCFQLELRGPTTIWGPGARDEGREPGVGALGQGPWGGGPWDGGWLGGRLIGPLVLLQA